MTRQPRPDYLLTLRPPDEPEEETIRRLRAALKGLLRRYGLRCVHIRQLIPNEIPQHSSEKTHAGDSSKD